MDKYQWDEAYLKTRDYVRIGYPVEKGSGSTITGGYVYLITKNASHPKEAWDFIRSVILDRAPYIEIGGSGGIRMLRSQYEAYANNMKNVFRFFADDNGKHRGSIVQMSQREGFLDENGLHNGLVGTLVEFNEEDYTDFLDFTDSAGSPITEKALPRFMI